MAELRKELVCIVCPNGCRLQVCGQGETLTVRGNLCPKGLAFAKNELTHPTRTLTTTVRTTSGVIPMLPVRTDGEIPKEAVFRAMAALADVVVQGPVRCGQVLLPDLAGTGVAVIATSDLE